MIYINNVALPEQPWTLDESPATVKSDQYSISGKLSRNIGQPRKRVKMSWGMVKPSTIQYIDGLVALNQSIVYKNNASPRYGSLEFEGIISITTDAYARGGTGLIPLTITIEEGTTYPL